MVAGSTSRFRRSCGPATWTRQARCGQGHVQRAADRRLGEVSAQFDLVVVAQGRAEGVARAPGIEVTSPDAIDILETGVASLDQLAGKRFAVPAGTVADKLGTAPVTEPFSFMGADGKATGLDIELATYVARKLGKDLQVVTMEFGELLPAVIAGDVDMAAACITITAERSKTVLFSAPYYQGGIAALIKD